MISDKGLVSKTDKKLLKFNNKEKKNRRNFCTSTSPKIQISTCKDAQLHSSLGNTISITRHLLEWLKFKRLTT